MIRQYAEVLYVYLAIWSRSMVFAAAGVSGLPTQYDMMEKSTILTWPLLVKSPTRGSVEVAGMTRSLSPTVNWAN